MTRKLVPIAIAMTALLGPLVLSNHAYSQTEEILAQWDYGREPDVDHFILLYGNDSGTYAIGYKVMVQDWVAPPEWMRLPIPFPPGTYYLAVKAVDTSGNPSGVSNEAVLVVKDLVPPTGCSRFAVGVPSDDLLP